MPERRDPGLAPLLDTVAAEARQQAEALLAEARAEADLRLREAERSASEIEARAGAAGAAEGEREARRRIALAHIETRRELLRMREMHLERAIEHAIHALDAQLQGPEGVSLVAGAVRAAARALGETQLSLRAGRVDRAAVVAALGPDAPNVAWDEDDGPGGSGIVVSSADRHRMVDMTLDGIARRRHDAARHAAADALLRRDTP